MSGIMRLPDVPTMYLTVENYVASHWGGHLISVNNSDVETVTDGDTLVAIIRDELPYKILIPLSHPTTYLNDTAYPSGTSKTVEWLFSSDETITVGTSGPEMTSTVVSYLTINIPAVGGGVLQ